LHHFLKNKPQGARKDSFWPGSASPVSRNQKSDLPRKESQGFQAFLIGELWQLVACWLRFLGSMLQLKSKGSGIFNIWMKIQDSVWYKGSSRRGGGAHDGAFLVTEALSPIRAFLHGLAQICKAQESSCFSWLVSGKNEWRNRKVLIQYRPARNDDEII